MAYLALASVALLCFSFTLSEFLINDSKWLTWKSFHSKNYESEDEESLRYTIWNENLKFIERHNTDDNGKFKLQMNSLGDMVLKLFFYYRYVNHILGFNAKFSTLPFPSQQFKPWVIQNFYRHTSKVRPFIGKMSSNLICTVHVWCCLNVF